MRNRSGPRTEPCGTPDFIGFHDEVAPFKLLFAFCSILTALKEVRNHFSSICQQ